MNHSRFYRLIRPMVSSKFGGGRMQDAFHGPSIGFQLKQEYHNNSCDYIQGEEDETEPFSLINHNLITKSAFRWTNYQHSREKLGSGMILLKNFITLIGQVDIVNICQKWGVGPGGFYEPRNRNGAKPQLHMTCFGRNWDPVTSYENRYRSDGSEPPPLPDELVSFTEATIKNAQFHMKELPSMSPDVCVVNFYSYMGQLGLHQDCDESSDSLGRGLPVVSISIGSSAEFLYGHTRDENKMDKVLLESGDVLIFGGKSRHIFHGVKRIVPFSDPVPLIQATRLKPGRLNLTLRQF